MKKLLLLTLNLLLLSWSINAQTAITPAGDGSESNPYKIANLENLYWITINPSAWDKHFKQTANIDASATSGWFGGMGWSPIGNSSSGFVGTYDGMGHTISNLYINQPESDYSGLFGYTGSMSLYIPPAKIQNLGVINVDINGGYFLGALVGNNHLGYISNCYSTGTVVGNYSFVGGLVGSSVFSSYITYCYSEANVTGATGDLYVGGLVGFILDSEISNSYSRGSVTSTFDHYHNTYCGGLVGIANGNALIRNCYSTGLVSGYVEPSLTAHVYGGLIARSDGTVSVVNSFWDIETSGATTSAGGTGKTTAQMKFKPTFTGWDFAAIWDINAGNNDGYPYLVTSSACVDGTLTLLTGFNTQNVYTNTNITPIVFYVGGGSSGASISPALPPGLSGVYDKVNSKYTISGICSSPVVYNYSVTTTGTKLPCNEATETGTITIIPQPECAGYAVGLVESYDDPDSRPEAFTQYPELAVGSPDGRPADLNFPGEYLVLDITGSPNLYRPAGSSLFLLYNVPLSPYPCNPILNVQCSMNGTEWSVPSPYEFQMEGYNKAKEITLTENTRYLKLTLTNCDITSGIFIDAVTYDPDIIPCVCVTYPDAPTAASNGPVCEGEALSLTASTVSGATYSWTGPNDFSSNEQNPTVNPSATNDMAGTYSVTVTVGECTSEPAITTVVVNPLPTAVLSSSDTDNSICAGDEVTFTASGGTLYEFFVDDVSQGDASATTTFITSTLTNGQVVTVEVTNTNGCSATSDGITTTVNPLPVAGLSSSDADNTICEGDKVTFTASGGALYEFFVDDISQGDASATATFITSTLTDGQVVTVEVTNANGCSATSGGIFTTVNPLPEVSITGNNNLICYDKDAYFYLEGTPGTVVTYSFDGGTSQSTVALDEGSATVIYNNASGDVTLSLISIELTATGCTRELTETSTVQIYIPTAIISGNQVSCVSTTLTALTDASSPIFEWHKDGILLSGQSGSTLEVTQSGSYKLVVTDGITSCSNISEAFTVTINPLPEVSITGNNSSICYVEDAEFYLKGTPGAVVTYNFNGGTNWIETLNEGITKVTSTEAPYDITLSLVSIKDNSTGCSKLLDSQSTVTVNPDPIVSIEGNHEDCTSTTLKAVTDTPNPVYAWFIVEGEEPIQVGDGSTLEVTQSDNYWLIVTDESTGCNDFSGPFTVSINPLPVVAITGDTAINVGETTTLSPTSEGIWVSYNPAVATVTDAGVVTGIAEGTATFTFTDATTGCSATTAEIKVTGTPPVFTACPGNQTSNTAAGLCSAVVTYEATATSSPEPIITYQFSGATTGSGSGTGSGSTFNRGETYVTITASNGILPDATCSFKVTVTDNEDPIITCAKDITQTADQGMCSATVNVVPPAVSDNCDIHVLPVSNTELIKNGNFNEGVSNWQDCSNTAEVNTEEYYIVPLPPKSSNYVAEVDDEVSLCQTISGLTVGNKYVLTFKATRRQNEDTPNPVSANVIIDGGALSEVVTRTNATFDLTPETFVFTATQETHQLTFTPYTDNTYVLGFIVDDVSVRSITYPVRTTTLVWTATDVYGNTNTCEQDITVTDNEAPVIIANDDIEQTADPGLCSAVVTIINATATDNCVVGAVTGTRDDEKELTAPFPVGTTTITWTVSDVNGNPAVPVTQLVTVMDTEAPAITCAEEITQTADQGMCSATVNVVPPAVSDNCDNHVLPISNTELINNGNFNAGILNWQDCGNKAEVETEEFYIVPLPPKSSNFVAEVDKVMSLCQEISGLTAGHKYALTFKATRRQNTITPNPVSANVVIDGGALSEVVTRTNTTFDLTAESFVFTATQETHKLTFTPSANNTSTLGLVVDDVSVRSITYPVGTTTLVWTATDVYGNTATCEQNITVTDDEVPTLACSSNQIVNVDPGLCQYMVKGAEFDAVYEDNCEIAEVWNSVNGSASSLKDALLDAGTHTITWTVKDGAGNTNSCSFTVTVTDDQLPSLIPTILPTSTTYTSGGWTSTFSGININNTGKTYALVNPGEPVNLKFDWQMVYTGSYCPGCITQHYVTLEASGFNRCNQSWSGGNGLKDYTFNAPATPGIYYISLASSWWYSCNQYYTMYGPNSAENALGYIIVGANTTCPVNVVKNTDNGECTAVVNYGLDVVPDDNCGIKNLTYTLTGATTDTGEGSLSSYTFYKGVTTVTYTVTDVNQNSYSCDFTVTITDKQAPVPPGNSIQTVECVAQAEELTEIPVAFDNCDGEVNGFLFSVTDNPDPLIIEGTRIYKYIYTDADGNVSYWTYTYNIIRTSPPHEEGTSVETASTVECFDLAVAPALPDVQDVCGNQLPAPEPVITDTPGDSPCEGTREYRYTYVDDKDKTFVWVYTYTIDDTTPPELVCKNPTVVLDRDGKASITLEDILESGLDNCGTINYELIGQTSYSCSDVPSKTVILKATDCAGNIATCEATVTIDLISTRLVYSGATKGQYSDPVTLEATLTETSGFPIADKKIVFTLGEQTIEAITDEYGVASDTLVLNQNAGPYTLVVTYDEECPYASTTSTSTFIVLLEQACLDYTGVVMASTGSVNSTMATVLLAATFTQENDGYPGKLSDAHIQFFDDEFSPISPVLTPGLVDPNDTTIGSVVYEWEVDLEADQSKSYTIYAYTGNRTGYYSNWADLNCILTTIITVYKPGTEFIAGGGYLILEQPSGSVQADVASKNNFGFNVKFNKKGTNLQGNINTIVRKTLLNPETGEFEQHCYQIKGNVLSSLTVGTTVEGSTPAVFTGKANLQDVTDPENPISVDGNFVLKVTMTDKGEPGSSDMISITAFDKSGGIWFTSRWENNIPVEQLLDGGNLVVMGAAKKSAELAIGLEPEVDLTGLKVYPNPFSDRLKFEFSSPVNTQARLLMYDITGKLVCTVFDAPLEQGVTYNVVFIPETEISGMYIYRMIMGDSVFTGKAIYKKNR